MPTYKALGGAPRLVLRPRARSSSAGSLRRLGAGGLATAGTNANTPIKQDVQARRPTPAAKTIAAERRSATPVRSGAAASSSACDLNLATDMASRDATSRTPVRLSTGTREVIAPAAVRIEDDTTACGGKLNADAAVLPPWSCVLNHKIRYQPTTLVWKVHEVPKGMARAVKALDARRYQPMSADHGLHFKHRDAKPGAPGSTATLERICRDSEAPPREGVQTPSKFKWDAPTWWGCGPKESESLKLTSSYEDLGENFQEQGIGKEMTHSISVPMLDGRYVHDNPFMSQFAKRTDGGCIVYDVSVNGKAGCCLRDPKCPRPKPRGW